jgi:hypothetical protein
VLFLYNFVSFNKADDVILVGDAIGVIIENEPQILPDQTEELT